MTAPLRVALVGYGLAGRVIHRPLLEASPQLSLTHVVTGDPARRAQATQDLPRTALVGAAPDLWARHDEFDVVVVAAGNSVHGSLARRALDLGKAVVVDKPLALSSQDAADLASYGGVLSPFHNRRWDSDTLTARQLLDSGVLGTVHRLEARFTRFRPQVQDRWRERPPGGGVLLDLGTHLVDQAAHLLGPVVSVRADVRGLRDGAVVNDDAFLELRHDAGQSSLLWVSAAAPWTGPRLVLQGSRAGWVKNDLDGQEAAQRTGAPYAGEPDGLLVDDTGARPVASLPGDWGRFYGQFAAAVRGEGPVPVEPADAVAVARALEAAVVSSDRGGALVTL